MTYVQVTARVVTEQHAGVDIPKPAAEITDADVRAAIDELLDPRLVEVLAVTWDALDD